MTYSLTATDRTGVKRHTFETAEEAVSEIDTMRDSGVRVKVKIDSDTDASGAVTESERLIIMKEGRAAAHRGRDANTCPYAADDGRRALWIAGYRNG